MKTIYLLLSGTIILFFLTTSCVDNFVVHGNGIEDTEARITTEFKNVLSSGAFDVHITNGNEYEVVVRAESNIIPYIETAVSGNTLYIETRGLHNLKNRLPMEIFITSPRLEGVKLSGSGEITTDYFQSDNFNISISGSGNVAAAVEADKVISNISGSGKLLLSGTANDARFEISGSGDIDAFDLSLKNCSAKISGSGNMWINASEFIEAFISGSGNIFYSGNPVIESHTSGSGDLIHMN